MDFAPFLLGFLICRTRSTSIEALNTFYHTAEYRRSPDQLLMNKQVWTEYHVIGYDLIAAK